MRLSNRALILMATLTTPVMSLAQDAPKPVQITVDNFPRVQTDLVFAEGVKKGGFGKFEHNRQPLPLDKQTVIRTNRDTLYSAGVFDLAAGPATITLPDAGRRYIALQVINEDEYTPQVVYDDKPHTFTQESVGTRYVGFFVRTLVDPSNPKDVEEVHKLQDTIKVSQPGGPGKFEIPHWDMAGYKKMLGALLVLADTLPNTNHAFGTKSEVDPVRYLIGAASAWGGNPDKAAIYLNVVPPMNDGKTIYKLNVKDVPVDGFWSISLYNAKGYFQKNPYDAYALNNITAKKNEDGSVTVQFGGCDGKVPNCLPTMPGWNYLVRLYRPRAEILDGKWKFPEAVPAS